MVDKYKFSNRSLERLSTCHEDLQIIAKEAIKQSPYDFGVSYGYRSPDEQFDLFKKGRIYINGRWKIKNRSKIVTFLDGYTRRSKHNISPSEAFDIFCYNNGKVTWSHKYYLETALHILEIAEKLFEKEEVNNRLIWGGHWHSFKDWCHFQI
jgi:peptidoglycan L-alanyl-D-glutamate endopeptidase CwlK